MNAYFLPYNWYPWRAGLARSNPAVNLWDSLLFSQFKNTIWKFQHNVATSFKSVVSNFEIFFLIIAFLLKPGFLLFSQNFGHNSWTT